MTIRQLRKQLDSRIAEIFNRRCNGIQINVLDISKIYAAGRAAYAAGQDVEAAVVETVNQLRQN